MDYRQIIIDQFDILRKKDLAMNKPHNARAYAKVINQLKTIDKVTSIKDVEGMEGVGKNIHAKIQEILTTGRLEAAESANESYHASAFDDLLKVHGVGPVKARKLIEQGIRSITELRIALIQDESILTPHQKVGLKHLEDLQERIPRQEMDRHKAFIHSHINDDIIKWEITGSYRRNKESSGDIDVLISVSESKWPQHQQILHSLVERLRETGYVRDVFSLGQQKFMGVVSLPGGKARHMDILITPESEYPFALLYFTGSDKFNIEMRKKALEAGYSLSEKGFKQMAAAARPLSDIRTEQDIFTFLEMEFQSPSDR